jgi:heme iron utilization protein
LILDFGRQGPKHSPAYPHVTNLGCHTVDDFRKHPGYAHQNLKADSRWSLFVGQSGVNGDALGAARATVIGNAEPVSESDVADARERYVARHENSRYWVDFSDFSFFRLHPIDLYYVGGFGVMGWVEAHDYEHAAPDPLAESAPGILAQLIMSMR